MLKDQISAGLKEDMTPGATLFSRWSTARPVTVSRSAAPSADVEVSELAKSLATAVGASHVLVSVHGEGDDAAPDLLICDNTATLSSECYAQIARLAAEDLPQLNGRSGGRLQWAEVRLDQSPWTILRLPVRSRRGRSVVVLNLLFAASQNPRRERVAETIQTLRPMFEGYFRLWQRSKSIERGSIGLRAALHSLDVGIVLVDRLLRIVFSNHAADEMMLSGEHLRRTGDRMSAVELRDAMALQVALGHAVSGSTSPSNPGGRRRAPLLSIRSSRKGKPIILSVLPADQSAEESAAVAAVIYILDPRLDNARQLQTVCELYGLSPVEARLVCNLTGGASLQQAAAAMRIKEQTARGYLKQVFIKTDTRRQADLVRVMLCSLVHTQRGYDPVFLQ